MLVMIQRQRQNFKTLLRICIIPMFIIVMIFLLMQTRVVVLSDDKPHKSPTTFDKTKTQTNLTSADHFTLVSSWNQTLCSKKSDQRGPHQRIISLSIYTTSSNYTNSGLFSWKATLYEFLEPLVKEVRSLLPGWIIRIYIDLTGSTLADQQWLSQFTELDICDIRTVPLLSSSLIPHLPGKIWRFLPIFDKFVDVMLSRDVDSPIIERETETLRLWLSDKHKDKYFYIARDHRFHKIQILGGLWGAALNRARNRLQDIFRPILEPSIINKYIGVGDQTFLTERVWKQVQNHSLIFDSYFCQTYGGQPFLSQRTSRDCFLGCIRPCCLSNSSIQSRYPGLLATPCPEACRPREKLHWTYC